MKSSNHRITFKVIIGYIILGVLATISSSLIFYEIKTLTKTQRQNFLDQNTIIKTGSLIANIYENESLARAAIQLNSTQKFNDYVAGNKGLLLKVDSLNNVLNKESQKIILDSIKLFIDKKRQNIIDLKNLKRRYNSDKSINNALNKLTSIDSVLGKVTIKDLVKNPDILDKDKREKFEEYVKILNKYNPKDSINKMDQKQIDSLLSISKSMLKEAQRETSNQRVSLQKKEQELIGNDLTIFRKLQELLNALERDIIYHVNKINQQKEQTLNRSKSIIVFAAGTSFIIVIIFSIIILNDFWKTQRYRKQLEEANATTSSLLKSREQLISMVSHDLRTPLNTISGFSELLQNTAHQSKEKNYIEHIRNASEYMGKLVDDLLEFSKLENKKIAVETIPFDLRHHIDDIVSNTKPYVQDKPIEFIIKHDETIAYPVLSDPFRLKQILYNLVINACKFTNQGSITIESKLYQKENSLHISVSDTGIGIGKNEKAHIFEAFAQAENNKDQKQKGFGLGLAISKKIAELLGGTLTLESQPKKGSTFTLQIPVRFSKQPLSTPVQNKLETYFNLKAVVVEDDAGMRQLLQDLLKQNNVQVFAFENAQKALEKIDTIDYDFVLTDIQLPKMNGIHFMETLKNHGTYKSQPIIAVTGRAKMSAKDYINSGFSEILMKPFEFNALQRILQQFFPEDLFETNHNAPTEKIEETIGFNIKPYGSFVNNDIPEIKRILNIFLKETKTNYLLLKEAKQHNDIDKLNNTSHKMMGMFKQLEVVEIIPFLEVFETTNIIDSNQFKAFEDKLDKFMIALANYLS